MNEEKQFDDTPPGEETSEEPWSQQQPQQQQPQQPQPQQQPPQGPPPHQQFGPRRDTPVLSKNALMAILMISLLLTAIGGLWIAISGVPPYEAVDPDEDIEDRQDAREEYQESMLFAQTVAGIITWLGLLIGAMVSIFGAFGDTALSEEEQRYMLLLVGFFVIGLVLFFNHYAYMIVGGMV